MSDRYLSLLQQWCDKLIDLQIRKMQDKNFYGGILCPACSAIHGRIGDAVYPFVLLYDKTGEQKYLDAAKCVVDWSEYNVLRSDGSYFNDKPNSWKGITVFSAMSIGETLLHYSHCLDSDTKEKWMQIFTRFVSFIYNYFDSPQFSPNINYYVTECPVMALAFLLTGEEKYKQKAYEKAAFAKRHFTADGLLYGEGSKDLLTEKGCRYVDLGYNVEESLPALTVFAHLLQDEAYLQFCADKFATHIEFMLPDGAWDNSWGTRAGKWTYWGSRTSDGAQVGLCILAKYDALFAEAAQRNFELLEACSHDGLLYGGKMYIEAGEDPCVHHTFCHAKALCAMIEHDRTYEQHTPLPRETEYGVKHFPSIHVNLIAKGSWRATVSDYDAVRYPGAATSGGTVTMLWHSKTGPVLSAAMAKFSAVEPRNFQLSRHDDTMENIALRLVADTYESVNDIKAEVSCKDTEANVQVHVRGTLRDIAYHGNAAYKMDYSFAADKFTVTATAGRACDLLIPVICAKKDTVDVTDGKIVIERNGASITIESNAQLCFPQGKDTRRFNVIGGFETLPISVSLAENTPTEVVLSIQ